MSEPEQALPVEQPSLFFPDQTAPAHSPAPGPLVRFAPVTPTTSLAACALAYQQSLKLSNHSAYTVTCFLSDLRLLSEYLGSETQARALTRATLTEWIRHLQWERGATPAPKTMARRVTFLKNFCAWLVKEGALATDPSATIALARPSPPLPELLFDDEVSRLEAAAAEDVRCHLLVMLLLSTGLKKEEVMGLRLQDVDLSDPGAPIIEVRFPGQAKRRRERRMPLPAAWTPLYERYLARYQPQTHVFECTDRNMNYILLAAVKRARIEKRVTLQLLRDIYAVRQLRAGASFETLQEKLGLSDEAWYETAEKYRKLAFPAGAQAPTGDSANASD